MTIDELLADSVPRSSTNFCFTFLDRCRGPPKATVPTIEIILASMSSDLPASLSSFPSNLLPNTNRLCYLLWNICSSWRQLQHELSQTQPEIQVEREALLWLMRATTEFCGSHEVPKRFQVPTPPSVRSLWSDFLFVECRSRMKLLILLSNPPLLVM
jgi:hypothetical protein